MGKRPKEERRAAERIPCKDVLLAYQWEPGFFGKLLGKKNQSKPLPARNISRDEVCFLSKEELAEGTELRLTIDFGQRNPTIHVGGKVVRTEKGEGRYPHKIGVGFTDVPKKSWEVLCELKNICKRRETGREAWRLHHTRRRESRPGGALESPREKREEEEETDSTSEEGT